ncbi:hypothetical protein ACFYNO_36090 [Kitasatospora sp. NPDC006697]|uniref:hypothetical protein n=1 Tax=Kitasatospora sp. NPDC006697 TaxID=3364020 RepID=UPI00368A1285
MSFKRRYMDSLLSAAPHPAPEPASGRAVAGNWWRRFLASLLDVPSVGELSSHVALDAAPEVGTEGRAGRQASKTALRARFEPALPPAPPKRRPLTVAAPGRATVGNQVIMDARSRSWGWAVAGVGLCLLVGLFALANRQSPGPIINQPAPTQSILSTPGSTVTTEPTGGPPVGSVGAPPPTQPPPSTPAGTPGQVLWQGTLTFPSQPGSGTHLVAATPATPLLAGEALYLCGACSPQVIGGELLVPWNETKSPTPDQCSFALTAQTSGSEYVPLRVGQAGCFSSGAGTVGYFTLLTTSPLSASAIIWHA